MIHYEFKAKIILQLYVIKITQVYDIKIATSIIPPPPSPSFIFLISLYVVSQTVAFLFFSFSFVCKMSKQLDARSRKPYYWPRLVIYVVILILLYQFFTSFSASPMSLQSKNEKLPWYKHHHPRLPQYNPYATTNLTTQEREALTNQMVERASQLVSRAFPEMENKIIGSSLSQDEVVQFRSLVDCWTSTGKWVRMDGEVKVMSHYQDSLYGKCDRKHRGEGQREALRYVWQSKCAPIKDNMDNSVNEDRWCEVLRGRHLLAVGDLVQYQLHEIFLDAFRDGPTVCFGELNCRGNHEESVFIFFSYSVFLM